MIEKFDNILVIRTDRLGDVLMNVPLMRRLRQNYRLSRITVLCDEAVADAIRHQTDINEVMPIDPKRLGSLGGRADLIRKLRSRRFDLCIASQPSKFAHALAYLIGAPHRIGFSRKWGFLLNHKIPDRKSEGHRHEADYNLELLDGICGMKWDGQIDLGFKRLGKRDEILDKFKLPADKRLIVFHTTTSNPAKEWSPERFARVIEKAKSAFDVFVVIVGTVQPDHQKEAFSRLSSQVCDLTGQTNLTELALILGRADCVVSLDSGPYHLAWMQRTPVVGLFMKGAGASQPQRWGVYPGFVKARQIYKRAGEISEEDVLNGICECLEKKLV